MKRIFIMTMATIATTVATAQQLSYPKAEKDGTVDEYFGASVSSIIRQTGLSCSASVLRLILRSSWRFIAYSSLRHLILPSFIKR